MSDINPYALIRSWLMDDQQVRRMQDNPQQTLIEAGITNPLLANEMMTIFALMSAGVEKQKETALAGLQKALTPDQLKQMAAEQMEMLKKNKEQLESTFNVATEMKTGLIRTVQQIDKAFGATMLMYKVSFYLGVCLIVGAVIFAAWSREPLLPSIFGTLGTLDILVFFLTKPQENLQSSRAILAQLQAAMFNWFTDAYNQNVFLGQLSMQQKLDFRTFMTVSDAMMQHTEKTLEMMQKYCKLPEFHRREKGSNQHHEKAGK
jgi:hypothetical protein